MNKKKIVFLTGTRADFGKLKPLINIVENSENFDCYIFVTGMHTLSKYGATFTEIKKLGYKHIFIFMNQTNTTESDIILSNTVTGFSNFIKEIHPDMIVLHGDRIETLAGAITGSFNNILVSHIEGGELSGTIDELIRHSVSKLSHIHFVSNDEAKKRVIQMGESKNSIFVIGSPDIDIMYSDDLPSIEEVKSHYDIPYDDYATLIFHPITTEISTLHNQIKEIVSALVESKKNYVIIYPNNDSGCDTILKEYDLLKNMKNFKVLPSLRFEYFLTLLKNSKFLIGNSSAGIKESGVYGIPTINIGTRQKNRSKNRDIINITSDKSLILTAIASIENKKIEKCSHFGDGKSSERFFHIISDSKTWEIPIQKQFIDLDT